MRWIALRTVFEKSVLILFAITMAIGSFFEYALLDENARGNPSYSNIPGDQGTLDLWAAVTFILPATKFAASIVAALYCIRKQWLGPWAALVVTVSWFLVADFSSRNRGDETVLYVLLGSALIQLFAITANVRAASWQRILSMLSAISLVSAFWIFKDDFFQSSKVFFEATLVASAVHAYLIYGIVKQMKV